jgi:preprotein translocase subunit SecG
MFKIFFKIVCFLLIFLILFRIPEKEGGSLNFNMLGFIPNISKKTTMKRSQILTWFLIFFYFLLNSIIFFRNL